MKERLGQIFYEAGKTWNLSTKNKTERQLTNALLPLLQKQKGVSAFRAVDPGSMQNSLGCDFILCVDGFFVSVEAKRIKTKSVPTDDEKLKKLLTASELVTLEKTKKAGGLFLYLLFHNDTFYIHEA